MTSVIFLLYTRVWASQVALVVKNPPANARDMRDLGSIHGPGRFPGSIPGQGRSPGEGNGNPLQCSCLENTTDRGAWWAVVYGVAQSRTRLKRLSSSSSNVFNTKSSGKGGDRNSHGCLLPYGSGDQRGGYPGETNKQSFIHPFKYLMAPYYVPVKWRDSKVKQLTKQAI